MKTTKVTLDDGSEIEEVTPENAEDVREIQKLIDEGKAGTCDQMRKIRQDALRERNPSIEDDDIVLPEDESEFEA